MVPIYAIDSFISLRLGHAHVGYYIDAMRECYEA